MISDGNLTHYLADLYDMTF